MAEYQQQFGRMLRTPLERTSGTLTSRVSAHPGSLRREALDGPRLAAAERLAVYNRQYWFRLFGVMHGAYPLTARLLGYWTFNELAAGFLVEHPPRSWNIEHVPEGFDAHLLRTLEPRGTPLAGGGHLEREALLDASRIDAAWRRVFLAPEVRAFRPTAADAARLPTSRLMWSPCAALLEERWPLVELRRSLLDSEGESAVALPPRLPVAQWWLFVRKPAGIGQLRLEPREAELFLQLQRHTVSDALGRLERGCAEAERAELPALAQGWLARGVEIGLWTGLDAAEP